MVSYRNPGGNRVKPTGYYILIEMEEVKNEIQDGALKGFSMGSIEENKREQSGHDVGVIRKFGPTVFKSFAGIDDSANVKERCFQYGVKVGDRVEFNRYDGKIPRHPKFSNYRIIQDQHIVGVYDD